MVVVIDKLFKGYTVKEIEEILFKAGLEANKNTQKPFPRALKPSLDSDKRVLVVWAKYLHFFLNLAHFRQKQKLLQFLVTTSDGDDVLEYWLNLLVLYPHNKI